MPPSEFKAARSTPIPPDTTSPYPSYIVAKRPYFPTVAVSPTCESSITLAASLILYHPSTPPPPTTLNLKITSVKGGITNALFRVSGFPSPLPNSVLLRVFGAEGMIDRDEETYTYAALCDTGIGGEYYGRFKNGRVEGWLDGYRTLEVRELSQLDISLEIAKQLKYLHERFVWEGQPGLWKQLFGWLEQAEGFIKDGKFKSEEDGARAEQFILVDLKVGEELNHLKEKVVPPNAKVCFCHNDLLAANVMMKEILDQKQIQFIDFEYGGMNFAAFDIANHFNEFAGGTDDGKPNYDWFPSKEQQRKFIEAYLGTKENDCSFQEFWKEVKVFLKVNHLYWGLWAVNQAAMEGCEEFDYLLYAENRFKRYTEQEK